MTGSTASTAQLPPPVGPVLDFPPGPSLGPTDEFGPPGLPSLADDGDPLPPSTPGPTGTGTTAPVPTPTGTEDEPASAPG